MPWTFSYHLDTLELYVPFGYLGPLGTFLMPWTIRYILDTVELKIPLGFIVPLGCFGPLGTFEIP